MMKDMESLHKAELALDHLQVRRIILIDSALGGRKEKYINTNSLSSDKNIVVHRKGPFLSQFWSPSVTSSCFVFTISISANTFLAICLYNLMILTLVTSTLKMEAACSFETLVSPYKTTPCHNPEDHSLNNLGYFKV
jgi:hypothetical protein